MDCDKACTAFFQNMEQPPELKYVRFLYSRTVEVYNNEVVLAPSKWEVLPSLQMYGIANVRIVGNEWNTAELIIGGHVFDKICSKLEQREFPMLENGCCLPCCEVMPIRMKIDGKCDSVAYDIVVSNGSDLNMCFTCKGSETVSAQSSSGGIELPFHYRVEKLIVKSDVELSNVETEIDGNLFYPASTFVSEGGAFPFTMVFNFSPAISSRSVNRAWCRFLASKPGTVHVISLHSNLFSFDKDICGQKFKA